jgi:hypothetical protein
MKGIPYILVTILVYFMGFLQVTRSQSHMEPEIVVKMFSDLYSCRFYDARKELDLINQEYISSDPDLVDICATNYFWWQITTSRDYGDYRDNMIRSAGQILERYADEPPGNLDEDALFAVVHSYAFITRLEMHEDNYIKGANLLRQSMKYLNEVLPRAEENVKFALLAGLYNYIMGSVLDRFPIFYPLFVFAPLADKRYGLELMLKCAECQDPMIRTEARYFLARVRHEIYRDYEGAESYLESLLEKYPSNQFFRSYRISILADSGDDQSAIFEYLQLQNFNCTGFFSGEQNKFLIDETRDYLRKKSVKF